MKHRIKVLKLIIMWFLFAACLTALVAADPIPDSTDQDGRIIGGYETTIEQFPHSVSLNYKSDVLCGGSIISNNFILTAAHCAQILKESIIPAITIRAGSNVTNEGGSEHKIVNVHTNSMYNQHRLILQDSAVIEVKPPFIFDQTRRPIKLVNKNFKIRKGALTTSAGFGRLTFGGPRSKTLRAVTLPIIPLEKCKEIYGSIDVAVTDDSICTGFPSGRRDTCQGDSGSALIYKGKQIGIVSKGIGCGDPNWPGVYQNVAEILDFIRTNAYL